MLFTLHLGINKIHAFYGHPRIYIITSHAVAHPTSGGTQNKRSTSGPGRSQRGARGAEATPDLSASS